MNVRLPASDMVLIIEAVVCALENAFHNSALTEPQLVANFVWALPEYINNIHLPGETKVKAGGVFVHARPLVQPASFPCQSPKSVEIGDLLLIRTLVVDGSVKEKRALLLQAKKADSIPAVPDNKNQWHLYEQWPLFTYAARSGGLTGKKRHIKEPDMYDAAKYLLICTNPVAPWQAPPCCITWPYYGLYHWPLKCAISTAQPTKPEIGRYQCFAHELVGFLIGNAGKYFNEPAPRTRGWDRVIQDLITETAKATTIFMGRAAGQTTRSTRGSGVLFMITAKQSDFFSVAFGGESTSSREPPDIPREWQSDDDTSGGISIIEVIFEQEGGTKEP